MTDRGLLRRASTALVLAFAGVALAAWLIRTTLVPDWVMRDTGMPTAKLRELRPITHEVDVLVVGTSRLLHGFDPEVFAAESARIGRPLNAYNLSLQRLLLWEQERILTDALSLPGLKPRLILVEPAVGLGLAPENLTHARTLEYETPTAWSTAVRVIASTDRPWWHQTWNIATHTLVFGLHLANFGAGTAIAFPPATPVPDKPDFSGRRGFLPLPKNGSQSADPSQVAIWCELHRRDYEPTPSEPASLPAAMRSHFLELRARLEANGVRVVFVQPPQLGFTTAELRRLTRGFAASLGSDAPVLSFLDPKQHPPLFAPDLWSDYNHLNAEGAAVFTRELVHALRPHLPEARR